MQPLFPFPTFYDNDEFLFNGARNVPFYRRAALLRFSSYGEKNDGGNSICGQRPPPLDGTHWNGVRASCCLVRYALFVKV